MSARLIRLIAGSSTPQKHDDSAFLLQQGLGSQDQPGPAHIAAATRQSPDQPAALSDMTTLPVLPYYQPLFKPCLLYTSDAADDWLVV